MGPVGVLSIVLVTLIAKVPQLRRDVSMCQVPCDVVLLPQSSHLHAMDAHLK